MSDYKLQIKNNDSGVIAEGQVSFEIEVEDMIDWSEEGNGSCDCNRGIYFDRFLGVDKHLGEYPCSEGKYSLNVYVNDEKIVNEF